MKRDESVIAIIPARGGSKRVPRKNLMKIAGLPMLAHSIRHAKQSKSISAVYVSTDDHEIAAVARTFGAEVIRRPPELSGDKATSESALLHVLDERRRQKLKDPDLVVFLQCTSPVRNPDDIDRAIQTLKEAKADSLFSACENKKFIWESEKRGPRSLNYDFLKRQREQDMPRQFEENGSMYIFKPKILRRHNNRLGGKIAVYEMDYWSSFQIDKPADVELIQWILSRAEARVVRFPSKIDLVVFDFDGVMTDNRVWVSEKGAETVACNRSDGLGLGYMKKAGVRMVVLSTEENPVVQSRCKKLKLECHQGLKNKADYLRAYLKHEKINPQHVVYLGNDTNDLDCFKLVGFPVAVADAHDSVIPYAKWILTKRGGHGAVRELCDMVLTVVTRRES